MHNRYGVIDLGTNTFHLLIVQVDEDGHFREIHRESRFIKLAENGIETIGDAPFQRGIQTLIYFKKIIDNNQLTDCVALGTAALRTASNGSTFIKQIESITGITPKIISGQEEARLIHNGVRHAVPLSAQKSLIMDIGGGSVEFIIADEEGIIWSESFPVGVAVLFKNFHHNNPIAFKEIKDLTTYLQTTLKPLIDEIKNHKLANLIGASGTFDVLENVLVKNKPHPHYSNLDSQKFYPYYEKIIATTIEQRLKMPDLPTNRADMIVVALVLIKFILEVAHIQQITISAYAMKEGLLYDLIYNKMGAS